MEAVFYRQICKNQLLTNIIISCIIYTVFEYYTNYKKYLHKAYLGGRKKWTRAKSKR